MLSIKPMSDLRKYSDVINEVAPDSPVILTINGRGRCVVMDIYDYNKMEAKLKLLSAIEEGELSARENGWATPDELAKRVEEAKNTIKEKRVSYD